MSFGMLRLDENVPVVEFGWLKERSRQVCVLDVGDVMVE